MSYTIAKEAYPYKKVEVDAPPTLSTVENRLDCITSELCELEEVVGELEDRLVTVCHPYGEPSTGRDKDAVGQVESPLAHALRDIESRVLALRLLVQSVLTRLEV